MKAVCETVRFKIHENKGQPFPYSFSFENWDLNISGESLTYYKTKGSCKAAITRLSRKPGFCKFRLEE